MKHPRNPRRKNKTGEKQAKRHEGHLLTDLFRAYFEARKNKRNTRGQLAFEMDLEHNLIELYEEIRDRTYRPKPCICFIVHRPVKREVFASQFRDRVVHHLLCSYLAPLFDKRMIFDSYSCRKKKGTKAGIERIEHHIRSCTDNYRRKAYILKMDLKGYFMSIDKKLLYDIITDDLARFARKRDELLHGRRILSLTREERAERDLRLLRQARDFQTRMTRIFVLPESNVPMPDVVMPDVLMTDVPMSTTRTRRRRPYMRGGRRHRSEACNVTAVRHAMSPQ